MFKYVIFESILFQNYKSSTWSISYHKLFLKSNLSYLMVWSILKDFT